MLFELNLNYPGTLSNRTQALKRLWRRWAERDQKANETPAVDSGQLHGLTPVTPTLFQAVISRRQLQALIDLDRANQRRPPVIFRVWPDYNLWNQVDRSAPTIKVDAAKRAFSANGRGVVWAVIDTGIDARHHHFSALELAADRADEPTQPAQSVPPADSTPAESAAAPDTAPTLGSRSTAAAAPAATPHDAGLASKTAGLHRDFSYLVQPNRPGWGPEPSPLTDEAGHGTHVAAIIAGQCPPDETALVASSDEVLGAGYVPRPRVGLLAGMAPDCELVSLKVFRTFAGVAVTSSAAVLAAIDYILHEVNTSRQFLRIHGVNLSLGAEWDPEHYAAGQSPLCQGINALVESGVVVVVSAGNNGQNTVLQDPDQNIGVLASITEPGHAQACITVGSTHREAPHVFGVSYTSSKGPTLDGRLKPDVVAPGEWICSAATGAVLRTAGLPPTNLGYAELSGTSAAAPHVSGIIAGFLSCRPEFIGRPTEVKTLLMRTATDLGRERYAQGAGLVDAMRMLADS